MDVVTTGGDLRTRIETWRRDGIRVGFVPTMGNLHQGHFSLVSLARQHADRVVASIFVNPTQFGPNEDFARYPRTPERDREGLVAHECDLLFVPSAEEIYPFGTDKSVRVDVPVVSESLEGAIRPGHFAGVATVVAKLFNLVQPDVAVFGRKDYQQLLVIRRMVTDLCMPIEIVPAPIEREANGLAMSSRNQYLSAQERERAAAIYMTLKSMRSALHNGDAVEAIEAAARTQLMRADLTPDYASLCRADDLGPPGPTQRDGLVALIAARIGRTRLIDNLACGTQGAVAL
jgi:pantoate--beta-alanine ligase